MGYYYTAIRISNIQNTDKIEDLGGTGTNKFIACENAK